jgi:predicted Zn-dependent peptidase
MRKGDFTDADIKKAIISNTAFLEEMEDSPDSIMRMYQNYEYLHLDLKDRRIKLFNKVTKEDIVRVASKIEIDTIYLLEGSKRDEKND